MGVRRISVGGSLARVAMHAFIKTATEIAKDGKFDGFAGLITNAELNKFFGEDRKSAIVMTRALAAGRPAGRRDAGARCPDPVTLKGRFGTVERLDAARHGATMWEAIRGHDGLWAYNRLRPVSGRGGLRSPGSPSGARSTDPFYFAIVDRAAAPSACAR